MTEVVTSGYIRDIFKPEFIKCDNTGLDPF